MSRRDIAAAGNLTSESSRHGGGGSAATPTSDGWTLTTEPLTVTVLFDSAAGVDAALDRLYTVGMPRDLIEVVVSREAAAAFPGRPALSPGRETFRYAGIGGLAGLVFGAVISLGMVAWPGLDAPGGQAIVQLLGPNFGLVTGAALGAAAGSFRHRRPDPRHARAADAAGAILVAVATRSADEGAVIAQLLVERGGRNPRIEPRA